MAYSPFFQPWRVNQFGEALRGIREGEPPPGRPSPKIPPPGPAPLPLPRPRGPNQPGLNYVLPPGVSLQQRPAPPAPAPKLEVSPFLSTVYKSIQNIDPEQRADYLQTTAASIKERLDRFEFRLARGIPLTPEQQRQYDSIRSAYNDIQKYINNPMLYDEYFANLGRPTPQAAPPTSVAEEQIRRLQRLPPQYRPIAKAEFPRSTRGMSDQNLQRLRSGAWPLPRDRFGRTIPIAELQG